MNLKECANNTHRENSSYSKLNIHEIIINIYIAPFFEVTQIAVLHIRIATECNDIFNDNTRKSEAVEK